MLSFLGCALLLVKSEISICLPLFTGRCLTCSPKYDTLHNHHWILQTNLPSDARIWRTGSLKQKWLKSLFWLLKINCNLQCLSLPLIYFCNLVLVCSDSVSKSGKDNCRRFSSTVGTFSIKIWLLFKNNLKHLSMKFFRQPFFWKISLKNINCEWNIDQLQHI